VAHSGDTLQAEGSARLDPGASSQRNVDPLSWNVVADVSQATPQLPPGLPMRSLKAQKPPTPLVDPADVQSSPLVRGRAWADCLESADQKHDQQFVALLKQAYRCHPCQISLSFWYEPVKV
jgi:hypothetical protein